MKNFALLWVSGGKNGTKNETIETFQAKHESDAITQFRKRVPHLADNGYSKENDGIWCVAEEFAFVG